LRPRQNPVRLAKRLALRRVRVGVERSTTTSEITIRRRGATSRATRSGSRAASTRTRTLAEIRSETSMHSAYNLFRLFHLDGRLLFCHLGLANGRSLLTRTCQGLRSAFTAADVPGVQVPEPLPPSSPRGGGSDFCRKSFEKCMAAADQCGSGGLSATIRAGCFTWFLICNGLNDRTPGGNP
jgi:hypothetical protein